MKKNYVSGKVKNNDVFYVSYNDSNFYMNNYCIFFGK